MISKCFSLFAVGAFTAMTAASALAQDAGESGVQAPPAVYLSAAQNDGPKEAEELTLGMWVKAGNVTTYTIGNSWNDWILWLVYDKLREPSPYAGEAEDWLATSITQVSEDARVWEIDLREGVKWHDGSEFTAEDVAFTFEYYREGPANRWTHHSSSVPRMVGIEVIDTYKVRLTSEKPMPNFDRITATDLPIIQKAQWEGVEDPRSFTDIGIGTGPYRLVDYEADRYYKFEANENYWRGKPTVKKLNIVMIKDPQTMFTALKTGEIDGAARPVPPELVLQWKNDSALEMISAPTLWGVWLDINVGRKPFDDRDLRRAVTLAINPEPMLERVVLGQGKSGKHGWPHVDSFWTKPDLAAAHDPELAMSILDEGGYADRDGDGTRETPDGKPLVFDLKIASNQPTFLRAAEIVTEQLKEVGVGVKVTSIDPGSMGQMWRSRQFDLRIADITPHGIADQDMLVILYRGDIKNEMLLDEDKKTIVDRWLNAETREDRLKVSYELQEYQTKYPNRVMLWYPETVFAYRWQAYDNYVPSTGYGIFHKYSFLPEEARDGTVSPLLSE
ncbi:ABC transporter substrate-binding protein [Roseibium marinum]|uniref:Peptide/nickel transport system substrate-binding protein n=1 Tax=Roseibium marinum TaxID=281252 RepID=A0A2S3UKE3_9HYPH|nr:ABC transporter substrate-binding protein [Roseibium marinum]POF28050.1 peptide/nickel transport system substrate-binding protein [Roseibium marinum]